MVPDSPLARSLTAQDSLPLHLADQKAIRGHVTRPIVSQLNLAGARNVLDLGCGPGWLTSALDRCGFETTGLDDGSNGIEQAKLRYPSLPFIDQHPAAPLRPDLRGQFDAVVSVEAIEHQLLPRLLIGNAVQALRPGGLLIVTTPYHGYLKNLLLALTGGFDRHWHPLRDHGHVKFFSRQTLSSLLAEFQLQDLHFETIGRIGPIARSMLMSGWVPG